MAMWSLGGAVSSAVYLKACHAHIISLESVKSMFPTRQSIRQAMGNEPGETTRWNWQIILSLFSSLNIGLYALATSHIPQAIAAVILESWPVFYVLMLGYLFRSERSYSLPPLHALMFILALGGVSLVVLSSDTLEQQPGGFKSEVFIGGALLAFMVICSLLRSYFVRWGDVACRAHDKELSLKTADLGKSGYVLILRMLSYSLAVLVGLVVAWATGSFLSLGSSILALVLGGVVNIAGNLAEYTGTYRTSDRAGWQILRYTTPVFGVLFLWVFGHVSDVNLAILGLGMTLLSVANVVIAVDMERLKQPSSN